MNEYDLEMDALESELDYNTEQLRKVNERILEMFESFKFEGGDVEDFI